MCCAERSTRVHGVHGVIVGPRHHDVDRVRDRGCMGGSLDHAAKVTRACLSKHC